MPGILLAALLAQDAPVAAAPRAVTTPDWQRRATAEDLKRHYPDEALHQHLGGYATLSCSITAEGLLVGCRVVREMAEGLGFGPAALAMTRYFKMRPLSRDEAAVAGGEVRIPIRFLPRSDMAAGAVEVRDPRVKGVEVEMSCRYRTNRLDNCMWVTGAQEAAAPAAALLEKVTLPKTPREVGRMTVTVAFKR